MLQLHSIQSLGLTVPVEVGIISALLKGKEE